MDSKLKKSSLIYRKLKISDYEQFKKLFYSCFRKKISFEFFKWRYFGSKFSFCYGVFISSKLVANVGLVSIKLNSKSNEIIYSRHSSMVLKKYRGIGIFSDLLKKLKKKISSKVNIIVMWPNKKNFSNFNIEKKNIIKKKYYIYKTNAKNTSYKITENSSISELMRYKNYIKSNNNLFIKNASYLKKRYLSYNRNEYFINKYKFKNFTSFFILKKNKDISGLNYVILDHFGSTRINLKHLSHLINDQNKLIFLSKKKIYKPNHKLVDFINFKIGFIKKVNFRQKKNFLNKKEIYLGDTDTFMTI